MAISNNLTGVRPGVCTSTTRPTAPYEGQVIYETDTDLVRVWNGSTWNYSTTPQTVEPGIWQTWTPVLTASSGTITAYTINRARYCIINKLCVAQVDVTITTAGTAAGAYLYIPMPVTAAAINATAAMRETNANGSIYSWQMFATTSSIVLSYTGGGVIANAHRFPGVMVYEVA